MYLKIRSRQYSYNIPIIRLTNLNCADINKEQLLISVCCSFNNTAVHLYQHADRRHINVVVMYWGQDGGCVEWGEMVYYRVDLQNVKISHLKEYLICIRF